MNAPEVKHKKIPWGYRSDVWLDARPSFGRIYSAALAIGMMSIAWLLVPVLVFVGAMVIATLAIGTLMLPVWAVVSPKAFHKSITEPDYD